METIANTYDDIITRSYEEYYQVILTYITYRITHRYEAEDLTQDVFVRLLDYKQMLRPDTVKYFLFTIARNIVIDYIRRYYKKQEIDSYIYEDVYKRQLSTLIRRLIIGRRKRQICQRCIYHS